MNQLSFIDEGRIEHSRAFSGKIIESSRKTLDILDILVFEDRDQKGLTLSELSERLKEKPSTLHGILKTMIFCGYVEQDEHNRYRCGLRLNQIGALNRFTMKPHEERILKERLRELCRDVEESVVFYILSGGDRINYIVHQTHDIIKVDYSMLEERNLYAYPSGRVLVSFCTERDLQTVVRKHGYPRKYWNRVVNQEQLKREIDGIRREKVCHYQTEDLVYSFASPVFDESGELLGAVGVYMPSFRATEERKQLIVQKLSEFSDLRVPSQF